MLHANTPFLWACKFPFVHITLSFMAGIITAYYTTDLSWIAQIGFVILTILYISLVAWSHKTRHTFSGLGLLGLSSIFLAGYISLSNKRPEHNPYHLIHHAEHIEAYKAVVMTSPKIKAKSRQATIAIKQARIKGTWQPVCGKITLQWLHNKHLTLKYGHIVIVHGKPKRISIWLSEDMFDYKRFLQQQNTYHTHFVQHHAIHILKHKPPSTLASSALKAQKWLADKIKKNITDPRCRGLVLTLVLGMREVLHPDIKNMYIGAGVIHVLAVSGLHVGLLYILLLYLLSLLRLKKRRSGKLIILSLLWCYASITGLSPSVLRAVSMFSLFTTSSLLGRRSNSINTLAIAAFLFTTYNPLFTFHIGFQLSYAAVLGILWLQPTLYQCLTPSNPWSKKIWTFITVSSAAQLATLPLTLYYFHAFPTYFLLANAIVIPAAPIIIGITLLIIITTPLPSISLFLGKLTTHLITLLNQYINLIAHLPGSKIVDTHPSLTTILSLYPIFIGIWLFIHYRKLNYLLASTCFALLIATNALYHWAKPTQQWLFYSYDQATALAFVKNQKATIITSNQTNPTTYHSLILPHLQKIGVTQVTRQNPKPSISNTSCTSWHAIKLIALQGKKGIWLDNPNAPTLQLNKPISIDFLLIENSTITNAHTLLGHFKTNLLVIGPNNSLEACNTLQQQAHAHKVDYLILKKNSTTPLTL